MDMVEMRILRSMCGITREEDLVMDTQEDRRKYWKYQRRD